MKIDVTHHDQAVSDKQKLYAALDQKLRQSSFGGSAAQAHGIASGLVCRALKSSELPAVGKRLLFSDPEAESMLENLHEMCARDLNQEEFSFDLWLPEVDELPAQLEGLVEWGQGFLLGLMYDGTDVREQLGPELQEGLADLIDICAMETISPASEEDQVAFIELREYVRMVTQSLYEELNLANPIDSSPK